MSQRELNTTIMHCDRCEKEVYKEKSAGWICIVVTSGNMAVASGLSIDLCDPCAGIFKRMMETTT